MFAEDFTVAGFPGLTTWAMHDICGLYLHPKYGLIMGCNSSNENIVSYFVNTFFLSQNFGYDPQ